MIQTRRAEANDINLIANLSRLTFYDSFHEQNTAEDMAMFLEKNFNDYTIATEMSDPENIFLIIEDEYMPLGYAKLSFKNKQHDSADCKFLEISRIYCIKEAIGKDVGKTLMMECINMATSLSMNCIWLGVWEHNARAIVFYKKFGFTKFDEHVFMLGTDSQNDWLMKKNIGNRHENMN